MIFKGYVWGGSLHGQILEHSRPDYVVKSCGGGNDVAAYRKPPAPYQAKQREAGSNLRPKSRTHCNLRQKLTRRPASPERTSQ